jgi:hypothetical protein
VSAPAHLEAGGIIWAPIAEGMAALMYGNGVGYHWKGLYNESLANTIGKSLQAQDLPAQVKFTLLVGSYLNRAITDVCMQRRRISAGFCGRHTTAC